MLRKRFFKISKLERVRKPGLGESSHSTLKVGNVLRNKLMGGAGEDSFLYKDRMGSIHTLKASLGEKAVKKLGLVRVTEKERIESLYKNRKLPK